MLRAEAAKAVDAVVRHGRSLDAALAGDAKRFEGADQALIRMLSYGCLRNYWQLKAALDELLDRSLKRRDSVIEALLIVGLFQLSDTRVPDHAAVSMTVEAARLLRQPKYAGLINAVLRNFVRKELARRESVSEEARFNHPAWLIEMLKTDWPDDWQRILKANNERAPMWLRVNARRMSPGQYLDEYQRKAERLAGLDQAVRLKDAQSVSTLDEYAAGVVSVQDGAAQIAAPWLLERGGRRILDACAAPGGKTAHLLELMPDGADLTAIDIDGERLVAVEENLRRLGLQATIAAADASDPDAWWDGEPFDRILMDAPCSATGVIRRHPDIKHLRRASDIEALARRQGEMLDALWRLLAPGGRLLYVTCSVLRAENDAVVGAFRHGRGDLAGEHVLQNNNIRDLMTPTAHGFQLSPGTQGLDGFYYACLDKVA